MFFCESVLSCQDSTCLCFACLSDTFRFLKKVDFVTGQSISDFTKEEKILSIDPELARQAWRLAVNSGKPSGNFPSVTFSILFENTLHHSLGDIFFNYIQLKHTFSKIILKNALI